MALINPRSIDPVSPTAWTARTIDGVYSAPNSRAVYRVVPNRMIQGTDSLKMNLGARTMLNALDALAGKARAPIARRNAPGNKYRQVHILATNTVGPYTAPEGSPIADDLESWFATQRVPRRIVQIGVPLEPRLAAGAGSFRENIAQAVNGFVDTVVSNVGIDASQFARDEEEITALLARNGLEIPSPEQSRLAGAWWNWGRWADTPILRHVDHIHVFTSTEALRVVTEGSLDQKSCKDWPAHIPGTHAISFAAVYDWPAHLYRSLTDDAFWALRLFDSGAQAISIRGLLEPGKVTRSELRRRVKQVTQDIEERVQQGVAHRTEQEDLQRELEYAEDLYSGSDAPPTLANASVVVAFDGYNLDWEKLSDDTQMLLRPLDYRQHAVLSETQPCTKISANSHKHDLPITAVAHAGLNSVGKIGDADGALVGFTEGDLQPTYLSPTNAAAVDGLPIGAILGSTGSGKTLLSAWLAYQFNRAGHPVLFINPKTGDNSLDDFVNNINGQVSSLDDLERGDGVFDSFRIVDWANPEQAAMQAAGYATQFLLTTNPWSTMQARGEAELPISAALAYGASHGGRSTWEALKIAADAKQVETKYLVNVQKAIESNAMFRLGCGVDPNGEPLAVTNTLTLVNAGSVPFSYPDPQLPTAEWNFTQRLAVATIRQIVYGASAAYRHRKAVIFFDEAWAFLKNGRAALDELGRLARAYDFLPIMMTQRATDVDGLEGYISRVITLPLEEKEGAAACKLLGIRATPQRLRRMAIPKPTDGGAASWESMHAIIDPHTREVKRGTIGWYRDLQGDAATFEAKIPDWFVTLASSNRGDIASRQRT